VIYADPAWNYRDKNSNGERGAAHKYKTMTTDDVCALDVESIAAEDAVLFLWAVPPMLDDALKVIRSWGFTYKTFGFLWAKRNTVSNTPFFGLGHWTRANVEPCLLATRGKPKRANAGVAQFLWAKRRAHSEKPAEVRDRIVKLCGDVPRVELFSRHVVAGWDRWGNELIK
jgi:N6-adenosine-specific RNA methylase IME4